MDEILDVLKSIQQEQREFRTEVIERLETIEKYAIHNGGKLDNHRFRQ